VIIQGGMGVGISNWRLARTVSRLGQLGVVSGTALDQLLARRLQDGDPGGHMRRALDRFPDRPMAERVWDTYYIPGGRGARQAYRLPPVQERDDPRPLVELRIVANFVEVFLAREGHDGLIGINYLEKIQIPHLSSIYGAMLAGVDYVLMGAGIPLKIPGVLDRMARHEAASYPLVVTGAQPGDGTSVWFDPADLAIGDGAPLERPAFLAIVASDTLAQTMQRRASGRVDGFVVELPEAGGHNAPPRGKLQLSERGEPVYGERDVVDLARLRAIGLPFWLAGGYGTPGECAKRSTGASGVQVGTAFAMCAESACARTTAWRCCGSSPAWQVFDERLTWVPICCRGCRHDVGSGRRDRPRICDPGFLREAYRQDDGSIGSMPGQPVNVPSRRAARSTTPRAEVSCNALVASAGYPSARAESVEGHHHGGRRPGGRDAIAEGATDYTAAEVVMSPCPARKLSTDREGGQPGDSRAAPGLGRIVRPCVLTSGHHSSRAAGSRRGVRPVINPAASAGSPDNHSRKTARAASSEPARARHRWWLSVELLHLRYTHRQQLAGCQPPSATRNRAGW
jgi:nitronate monooxygenase